MTPEITWTHVDSDTYEAWYRGELWVLLKSGRRTDRGPAGWYLHATEGGKAVLADDGRFVDTRIDSAPYKATSTILGARIRELEDTLAATDQLEAATRKDVAHAIDALHKDGTANALEILGDLLESLGGGR